MMDEDYASFEEEVRARVEARLEERTGLIIHAASFVTMNLFFFFIYLGTGAVGFPWPLPITFFWGIGMAAHALSYYYEHGDGRARRERLIQAEMEKERERLAALRGDKLKHDDLFYDDFEDERKYQQS